MKAAIDSRFHPQAILLSLQAAVYVNNARKQTTKSKRWENLNIPKDIPRRVAVAGWFVIKEVSSPVNCDNTSTTSLGNLQECLRHNIDKYANETLNTLNIARCVRELLSVHNIGQRLFAKFVLGLSQGTVSKLLSKPKPWDKPTEKAKDSHRKIHEWASDDQCIAILKSLVPRRGRSPSLCTSRNPRGPQTNSKSNRVATRSITNCSRESYDDVTCSLMIYNWPKSGTGFSLALSASSAKSSIS
ncbi:homeobox protein cut [Caerostris darwini]|uniref:Homeobox protein cut n=1 Tax=Caerostris darwini TaxID=1538125 RepID=A0AAV4WXG9_9ARAC|nr:homeobox protein cut [Caerostris darwini]